MAKIVLSRKVLLHELRSHNFRHLYVLGVLLFYSTLFYYFGELVDFFGWDALRWEFFYSVHDIHRLLFLAPIIYAGYFFGARQALIITIISGMIFLPRAFFISPFPDPMARMLVFTLAAGIMGYLTAIVRRESKRRTRLEATLTSERDKLLGILERMQDGVVIIAPDYRIRYMNPSMVRDFGEGLGSYCYKCLRELNEPCRDMCRLPDVINGKTERWEYHLPDGRSYEIVASPYRDTDGTTCQLATYRNIGQRKETKVDLENSGNQA